MGVLSEFIKRSARLPRVVLCESFDQRVLRAAFSLTQHRIAQVVLLGKYEDLDRVAAGYRLHLEGMDTLEHESAAIQENIRACLREMDGDIKLDPLDPVVAGAWLASNGMADAILAGAATTPTHVMRVYLKLIGVAPECKAMSGMSLVAFESCDFVRHQVVGIADVSVIPEPTVEQLADIAIQAAASYQRLTGATPRVAFLSFSTLGSSESPAAQKIREAVRLTRARQPQLAVDGELQLDAALVPVVAGAKSPSSSVAGNANVLIFPSLDAGNIAVKILQKFSPHRVIGPILQGLKCPAAYIPRASSADDIVDQVRLLVG